MITLYKVTFWSGIENQVSANNTLSVRYEAIFKNTANILLEIMNKVQLIQGFSRTRYQILLK